MMAMKAVAQPSPVNTLLIDPAYPTVGQQVTIYINANHYGLTTDNGHLSAWTGLITSASSDLTDNWLHNPISDWTDTSIVLDHVADVNNDSVFQLVIPDISTFYSSVGSETVFRICLIARGQLNHAVHGQTANFYFEVFGTTPSTAAKSYPAAPIDKERMTIDFNIKAASDTRVATYIASHPGASLYVHTGINTNLGDWQHVIAPWATNIPANTLLTVSDSIYRLYINPSVRKFYSLLVYEGITTGIDAIVRPADGSVQTETYLIPVTGAPDVDMSKAVNGILSYPTYPTVNDHIMVFINAKAYKRSNGDTLNPASTFTAWSGLLTSSSTDYFNNWVHQVNGGGWAIIAGDSIQFGRLNDSVQYWDIPSIASKYKVNTSSETVFRIALIARDSLNHAVLHQTDNLYFEVYGSVPNALVGTQPAKLKENGGKAVYTFNINKSSNTTLKDYIASSHNDTVGVYTGVYNTVSPADSSVWEHVVAPWASVPTTAILQTIAINDSIFRFPVMSSLRDFYGVSDTCDHIRNTNIVLRSNHAGYQTQNIYVSIDTMATCGAIPPVNVNNLTENAAISVFPNPVSEYLTFKFESATNAAIRIFNLQGQLVYSVNTNDQTMVKVNTTQINGSDALLIYQVTTPTGILTGKIVLVR